MSKVIYKFSIIFSCLYVILFWGNIRGTKIIFYLGLSLFVSIGIAGIGYALNDIKDYQHDVKNNKQNLFLNFTRFQSILLILLFLVLAIFPWYYLPFDSTSLQLLGIEFLLFYLYAFPPFRLKERGILGILADAGYAQVVPCILAIYTFSALSSSLILPIYVGVLFIIWLLIMGVRNIINHQIDDIEHDINTKTKTLITQIGIDKSKRLVVYGLLPAEWLVFVFLLFILPETYRLFFYVYLVYSFLYYFRKNMPEHLLKTDLLYKNEAFYKFSNTNLLNEFYEIHLPILLLLYFSLYDLFFLLVLAINLLFFFPIYYAFIKEFFLKNFK